MGQKLIVFVVIALFVSSSVLGYGQTQLPKLDQPTTGDEPRNVDESRNTTVTVPGLINFNGVLRGSNGRPLSGVVGVVFAMYQDQDGGAPLWTETQNIQVDEFGHYGVLLGGATKGGLPLELFTAGSSRWLGVQAQLPGETEQARLLMVSVPYALKAADADTLGGRPASAFVMVDREATDGSPSPSKLSKGTDGATTSALAGTGSANQLAKWVDADNIAASAVAEVGGFVGIGTSAPTHLLHMKSTNAQFKLESTGAGPGNYALETYFANGIPRFTVGLDGDLSSSKWGIYDVAASKYSAIFSGGNVGIGTTNPTDLMHLYAPSVQLKLESAGTGPGNYALESYFANGLRKFTVGLDGDLSSNKWAIYDVAAGAYTATFTGGNVGIGTTAPATKLEVVGNVKITGGGNGLAFADGTSITSANPVNAARIRGITYLAGCDSCSALAITDDQKSIYVNVVGPMTINDIKCYPDGGVATTINLRRNGTANNILSSALTCSASGGVPGPTIVGAESVLGLNDTLDFELVAADTVAKRLTVVIKATVN